MELDLLVMDPLVRGPLALYPLCPGRAGAPAAPAYLTGPEADRLGVLRVSETPGGATVPELLVHNTGALPLLLIEGETLVGAKQNRTLDASVLVPAGSVAPIPVSCVEAGRWGAPRVSSRSPRHAPTDLRRVKTRTRSIPDRLADKQSEVWDRIARYQADLGVASATHALEDVVESRAADVSSLVAGLEPRAEQRGVVVVIGGVPRGIDAFDKPSTLASYWDALTAGYALDAVAAPDSDSDADAPPAPAAVQALLDRVRDAVRADHATGGLGTAATFVGRGVVGSELCWDGALVHISAFVDDTVRP